MDFFEFLFKRNVATGLAIGVGVAVLGPVLIPVVAQVVRPAAKAVMKAGMVVYERGRETVAEVGEGVEDLYAEARSEMHQDRPAVSGNGQSTEAHPSMPGGETSNQQG